MAAYPNLESIQQLVADQASESEQLEFKSILPAKDDRGKHELAKDFSAMANAQGGTIIYGIAEQKGNAHNLVSITEELADNAIRRLSQSLAASVEPRLHGITFQEILTDDGSVVSGLIRLHRLENQH